MTDVTTPEAADIVTAATQLAYDLHREQQRKGTDPAVYRVPYLAHLLGVAALVLESPAATAEHVAAALLHDAVEDQPDGLGITRELWGVGADAVEQHLAEALRMSMGEAATSVAHLIMCATEDRSQELRADATDDERRVDWQHRKDAYLERLSRESLSDALISVADQLYNVRSIVNDLTAHGAVVWTRFNAPATAKLSQYRAINEVLQQRHGDDTLVRQFGGALAQLELLAGE